MKDVLQYWPYSFLEVIGVGVRHHWIISEAEIPVKNQDFPSTPPLYIFSFLSQGIGAEIAIKTFYWCTYSEFYCHWWSCFANEGKEIRNYISKQHGISRLYCWASLPSPSDTANYSTICKSICTTWLLNNNDKLKLCYLMLCITLSFPKYSLLYKHHDYMPNLCWEVWWYNFKLDSTLMWIHP